MTQKGAHEQTQAWPFVREEQEARGVIVIDVGVRAPWQRWFGWLRQSCVL